jgi:hypothetical protein
MANHVPPTLEADDVWKLGPADRQTHMKGLVAMAVSNRWLSESEALRFQKSLGEEILRRPPLEENVAKFAAYLNSLPA